MFQEGDLKDTQGKRVLLGDLVTFFPEPVSALTLQLASFRAESHPSNCILQEETMELTTAALSKHFVGEALEFAEIVTV